jgi:glycosyltransferase involved in cell wall biosynthesis
MGSKKMKIGVVFDGDLQVGGGFQYQKTILNLIKNLKDKYEFVVFTFSPENEKYLRTMEFKTIILKRKILDKIKRLTLRLDSFSFLLTKVNLVCDFEKHLEQEDIDLVYFLQPSGLALDLLKHNYIITVWDLCHRDYPEFPEVNFNKEFERREFFYTRALKKAVAIISDSETGKNNIIRRYGIDPDRVYVLPFLPSTNICTKNDINVKEKYGITTEYYIYYPAQFWAHKNHVYIIDSIALLKNKGIYLTAVFSGSDKGNLNHVLEYAKKKGVIDLIKYLGFVPDEDIYSLYKNALALVMPTYFGPTNIPPLEAFAIGTPVIYPDLPGLKEQVGDAALLVDLKNPKILATHLENLINSEKLRQELIEKGKKRLVEINSVDRVSVLESIFLDYEVKMKCWKIK